MSISGSFDYLTLRKGITYKGERNQVMIAMYPAPLISHAHTDSLKCELETSSFIFVEDTFNSQSNVRRGSFYGFIDANVGGYEWGLEFIMNGLYGPLVGVDGKKFDYKGLGQIAYTTKSAEDMKNEVIIIGDGGYETSWQVKGIERNIFGHQVFTLTAV